MPEEKVRPSATVILWRKAPALEVFLVERSRQTRFFPGYHAFPGGVLDAADGGGEDARARAAVRELEEETGVRLDPAALEPAGRIVTPPFGPVRYDTTFFMAELPAGAQPKVDGQELVSGRWWRPEDALSRFEREAMPLPPPTLAYLRLLRAHNDARAAAEAARATDNKPHHERFRIEIHPGVYVLPLRAPTLPPATTQNCYLLDCDPILLIDPGSPDEDEHVALFHTLDQMLRENEREILVLLTHHHGDHIGAVEAVQRRYGVRVLASPETKEILPEHFVDGVVSEGHVFGVGEWAGKPWRVEVLHTPGHTPGHLAFRDMRWGAIFAGDLVSGVSTILIDPREGDMGRYMRSLERCSALEPRLVLPGHGPATPRDAFGETLAHRRMREERVAAALTHEPQAPAAMLPAVYGDTPQEAWALAETNLLSHLLHLEERGLAVREKDGWRRPKR
ncbi:MAG TPA: MBL fold metallo-hydrolase [Candidatus Thermoplasmatota archaeon]|nr:MBL fold metallo-hydrolase [Candidatus Thermoplasmatota archaeon]